MWPQRARAMRCRTPPAAPVTEPCSSTLAPSHRLHNKCTCYSDRSEDTAGPGWGPSSTSRWAGLSTVRGSPASPSRDQEQGRRPAAGCTAVPQAGRTLSALCLGKSSGRSSGPPRWARAPLPGTRLAQVLLWRGSGVAGSPSHCSEHGNQGMGTSHRREPSGPWLTPKVCMPPVGLEDPGSTAGERRC